jgi:hypothetical protein
MRKGTTTTVAKARRLEDFRAILESRRAELSQDVEVRIRDVRSEGIGDRDVRDAAESSEIDIQDDIAIRVDPAEGGDAEEDKYCTSSH